MIELPSKTAEYNPSVIERYKDPACIKDRVDVRVSGKKGKFYRVFPMSAREVEYVASMEHGVDKFAPESGNGILVSSRLLDGKEVPAIDAKITLPVLSKEKAAAAGYVEITSPVMIHSEQAIILSMQAGMRETDAVWIAITRMDDGKKTPISLTLAVKRGEVAARED